MDDSTSYKNGFKAGYRAAREEIIHCSRCSHDREYHLGTWINANVGKCHKAGCNCGHFESFPIPVDIPSSVE